jgi:hypothetical protein
LGGSTLIVESLAVGTVVTKRTLSLARVLAESFHRQHPEVPFYVLLSDRVDDHFDPEAEPFRMLRLQDLAIPDLDLARFAFRYSQQELMYAVTPHLLLHLLDRGYSGASFLKQESLVVGDLSPVLQLLQRHAIVLTPHLLEALSGSSAAARECNILQSGVYNVGFLGVGETPAARAFLRWWVERLYEHCHHAVPQGMHFEQRWLDLVPAYFEGVHVVRDPGFNVAHWNLPDRKVTVSGERVTVDGRPGRFFRFSGFDPESPDEVTRYNDRLRMSDIGDAAELFRRYAALLKSAGYDETKSWAYAYDHFSDGSPIGERARRRYRRLGSGAERFGDPFDAGAADSFQRWCRRQLGLSRWARKRGRRLRERFRDALFRASGGRLGEASARRRRRRRQLRRAARAGR